MSVCEKCGKTYYTKECLKCKDKPTEKRETKKSNIPTIIIAIAVSIIALIMTSREYKKYQEEQMIAKMLYGTTDYDKIEKMNKKIMKQNEESMKMFRNLIIPK